MITSIALLLFGVGAMQGFLFKECQKQEDEKLNSSQNGVMIVCQNMFGFGFGAFIPDLVVSLSGRFIQWKWSLLPDSDVVRGCSWTWGMGFVFCVAPLALLYFTRRAKHIAKID